MLSDIETLETGLIDIKRLGDIFGADKSAELLSELSIHATRPETTYRHKWRPDDLVMLNNRCLLHCASTEFDMANERRILHRTVLSGTVPV
jgi:alpha-ketoglutarate-dependent taurine dioxygenase